MKKYFYFLKWLFPSWFSPNPENLNFKIDNQKIMLIIFDGFKFKLIYHNNNKFNFLDSNFKIQVKDFIEKYF